ncbi:hypothetical protein JW930_07760 [Candidatus Woesearchaeota archaeon]|nr:hypothetical protein [Candidatus Woesearchaeota archaeon]
MNQKQKNLMFVSALATLFVVLAASVFAANVPIGAEKLTHIKTETLNTSQISVSNWWAYAGNVTQMDLYGLSVTKHWQGFFGDITGTIVLDDAQNWTMYDWPNLEPKGEVYAVNTSTTPTWSNVECFNFTDLNGATGNLTDVENSYNITFNDVDGIDETYNMTTHPDFSIGTDHSIDANTCPSTYTHINDLWQDDKFVQLLLQDGERPIFMTIIENDDEGNNTGVGGFDTVDHDFQLLVPEDGTSWDTGEINRNPTRYWFYLDLE